MKCIYKKIAAASLSLAMTFSLSFGVYAASAYDFSKSSNIGPTYYIDMTANAGNAETGASATAASAPEVNAVVFARRIFDLTNAERAKAGASALTWNDTLAKAALKRANECLVSFAHERPDGTEFYTAVDETSLGGTYRALGENLAIGYDDAIELTEAWMNSRAHAANILEPGFTSLGVAFLNANGSYVCVQEFYTPKSGS